MVATKIHAKKYLWQNFLRNKDILDKIVWTGLLDTKDIIEIGPGPGDLTERILEKNPRSLTLIEIDADMLPLLQSRFRNNTIQIYWQDVLQINIVWWIYPENGKGVTLIEKGKEVALPSYTLYGNIPYYITSPIIHHFLYEVSLCPEIAVFTMQKEVADRILSRDGKHSVLSLSCQLMTNIEKICDINPHNFVPAPKVWSSCLKFTLKNDLSQEQWRAILKMIQKWFSSKRKKMFSNLVSSGYDPNQLWKAYEKLKLNENIRAEDVSLEQWKDIYKILNKD